MSTLPPPYPSRDQIRAQRQMMKNQMRAQRYQWRAQRRALRRGSILGPVILIGVGIVALMVRMGRIPAYYFWEWYGHWWPLLLVIAGVVLLLEWALDQFIQPRDANGVPLPVGRGIGFGVGFLLVLLIAAGITASTTTHVNWSAIHNQLNFGDNDEGWGFFLGDKHEETKDMTVAWPAGAAVSVESSHGNVTVAGTSDDGQIHIQLHKTVYAHSDEDAQQKLKSLEAQITSTSSNLDLRMPDSEGSSVDLVLTVPPAAALNIRSGHGDLHATAMKSALVLAADHGDVQADAITGSLVAKVGHGDFSAHGVTGTLAVNGRLQDVTISDVDGPVSLDGDFFGDTHLEHIRGLVHFHSSRTDLEFARLDGSLTLDRGDLIGDAILGPVKVKTRSKDVSLNQVAGDLHVENANGDISVTSAPPLGNVDMDDRRGTINLTVPEQAAFIVQAATTDGEVQTDFANLSSQSGEHGSLSGTVGSSAEGSAMVHIRINSDKGDISLKKGVIPPLPPLPPLPKLSFTAPAAPQVNAPKMPKLPNALKAPSTPKPAAPTAPPTTGATQEY